MQVVVVVVVGAGVATLTSFTGFGRVADKLLPLAGLCGPRAKQTNWWLSTNEQH